MSVTNPLLTVGIPTFNRAASLKQQLDRLLDAVEAQHLKADVEIVVVDNGSADGTREVLERISERTDLLRVYRNAHNLGCDANYLRTIEYAKGEWVWLLGDDEPFEPGAVGPLLKRLRGERADSVHVIPSWAVLDPRVEQHFQSIEALVDGIYSLMALQHLSSNLYRVAFVQERLRAGYRVAGSLHAYTALTFEAVGRGRGLQLYDLPLLRKEGASTEKRWMYLPAIIGALETLITSAPPSLRRRIARRAAAERRRQFKGLALRDVLGMRSSGFDAEILRAWTSLAPASEWSTTALILMAITARRSGVLPTAVSWLERWAPGSDVLRRLREAYEVPASATLGDVMTQKLTQPPPLSRDDY